MIEIGDWIWPVNGLPAPDPEDEEDEDTDI